MSSEAASTVSTLSGITLTAARQHRAHDPATEALNPILFDKPTARSEKAAVAIYFGLDVEAAVKWAIDCPDHGYDITLASNNLRIDVKTTLPPFKLIWSRDINDLYPQKEFHVLVSVSIEELNWSRCYIEGWITKGGFYRRKQIADGVNSRRWSPVRGSLDEEHPLRTSTIFRICRST